ncbi:hypothetical protein H6G80_27525 [Nostoc sp. FACHB-87]|uniref:hypothetical protein n=1 Tax=Nostocaceae TaxID=1162 RepID=UPI0016892D8A|nr:MULTISPECIES: hypothetical protein [Nostocaceae]MBD2457804.1 hypothetical protein [Nostoc sp. FACHB-87]MBD2479029.1 hypothetical protein [Anabaena sp. FACHB-83]
MECNQNQADTLAALQELIDVVAKLRSPKRMFGKSKLLLTGRLEIAATQTKLTLRQAQ